MLKKKSLFKMFGLCVSLADHLSAERELSHDSQFKDSSVSLTSPNGRQHQPHTELMAKANRLRGQTFTVIKQHYIYLFQLPLMLTSQSLIQIEYLASTCPPAMNLYPAIICEFFVLQERNVIYINECEQKCAQAVQTCLDWPRLSDLPQRRSPSQSKTESIPAMQRSTKPLVWPACRDQTTRPSPSAASLQPLGPDRKCTASARTCWL